MFQKSFVVGSSRGRGSYDVSDQVQQLVAESGVNIGLCNLFVHHTSASLMLCENADPSVRRDLEVYLARLVPDGDPVYEHSFEGPDDMAAHIRTILTQSSITLPVTSGRAALGTWQGVYLLEHRTHPHQRHITVTVQGD